MGVRISLYAIDVQAMEEFAENSLAYTLQYCVDHANSEMPTLAFRTRESGNMGSYLALAGKGISYFNGKGHVRLTEQAIMDNAFLSSKLKSHLVEDDNYPLYWVLWIFSQFPTIDWVTCISKGHRRWWIGTFLAYAQSVLGATDNTYLRLVGLMQRVLRGYDCGIELPAEESLPPIPFSLAPKDDSDLRMGFWTPDDGQFVCETIRFLMSTDPEKFDVPLDSGDSASDPEYEWREVCQILQELLILETPSLRNRLVLSFIG